MWYPILERYGIKKKMYIHTAFKPMELKKMVESTGLHTLEYGTIEKENVYSTIVAKILEVLCEYLFKKSIRLPDSWLYVRVSIFTYKIVKFFRLNQVLNKRIKEGKRSFIIAQKDHN